MRNRIIIILATIFYCFIFQISYIKFLNFYFEYANFYIYETSWSSILLSYIISIIPIVFYKGQVQISSFLSAFIYLLVYIPTIFCFDYNLQLSDIDTFNLQIVFMFAMIPLFLVDRFSFSNKELSFKGFIKFNYITVLMLLLTLEPLYVYRNNLKFVSFGDVYIQRFANMDLGNDVFTNYITSWLSGIIIPIVMLYGILTKKYIHYFLGIGCCVILYMATASKGTMLMPFILFGIYKLLSYTGYKNIYIALAVVISVFVGILLMVTESAESPIFIVTSIMVWRVLATGGQLNSIYYDFFQTHPHINYNHVGFIKSIFQSYPYGDEPVSRVVGKYYWSEDMNANANFWATDGIASFGIPGIFITSIVLCLIFILFNFVSKRYNSIFLILLFISFLGTLLNTSIFQSMWSGGGFFIILILLFLKTDNTNILRG